jgi:hypothetical protein
LWQPWVLLRCSRRFSTDRRFHPPRSLLPPLFWSSATSDLLRSFGSGVAALHRENAATKLPFLAARPERLLVPDERNSSVVVSLRTAPPAREAAISLVAFTLAQAFRGVQLGRRGWHGSTDRLSSMALPINRQPTKSSRGALAQPLVCTLNHVFVDSSRRCFEALRHRALISYRSRTVPRLLAWMAVILSQAFACVSEVSLPSVAPCRG